jgi:hypothetical protein
LNDVKTVTGGLVPQTLFLRWRTLIGHYQGGVRNPPTRVMPTWHNSWVSHHSTNYFYAVSSQKPPRTHVPFTAASRASCLVLTHGA